MRGAELGQIELSDDEQNNILELESTTTTTIINRPSAARKILYPHPVKAEPLY